MTNPNDDNTWLKLHILAEISCMFYDELQRTKKGKSKIQENEEDEVDRLKRLFDSVPRKARSSKPKYETLNSNGASTSSPSFPQNPRRSEPSSSRLPLTEVKTLKIPKSQSRKRTAVQDTGKSKKTKVVHLSWKGKGKPESLLKLMRDMNVPDQEPQLIFERTLYKTDVNPGQARLSMPISQVICNDFLTPEEVEIVHQDIENEVKVGVEAFLVNEQGQMWRVSLRRWESKTSWNYSVTCGWNDYVAAHRLKEDDGLSVWTFRCRGVLCLAIIPPPLQ